MIGRTISHFRILSRLGAGGMGVVYAAEDTRLGRRVALKLLPPEVVGGGTRLRRFQQEARTAAALNHPDIATLHEVGEADVTLVQVPEARERLKRAGIPSRSAGERAREHGAHGGPAPGDQASPADSPHTAKESNAQ